MDKVKRCRYCGREFTHPNQYKVTVNTAKYAGSLYLYECRWGCDKTKKLLGAAKKIIALVYDEDGGANSPFGFVIPDSFIYDLEKAVKEVETETETGPAGGS